MKNFVQQGNTLTLAAPYDVASGAGFLVGVLFAVATASAVSGETVEGVTQGVFDLTALNTDTAEVGVKAYWDNTNKQVTAVATDNALIGVFVAVKANGSVIARVKLDGVIR